LSIAGNQSVLRVTQTGTALPAAALARLQAALEAERKDRALRSAGAPAALLEAAEGRVTVRPVVADPDQRKDGRTGRFIMAMALWMNLVGSLGMLLQAVVRERSNRALESLLSLARPAEVVLGKLIGVGVLSLVVLAAWLGGGAAAAVLLHPFGGDVGGGLGAGLAAQLLLAAIVYPFAFAMFGAAIIGVGALANDGAAANSLSRPIFGVLLLVFFMVLWQWIEPGQTRDWLAFIPPFTPFALVLAGPGHTSGWVFAACLALMAAMTLAATALAAAAVAGPAFNGFTPERLWRIVENARIR
ncbi:MAG: ABC transporter permease, partial [Nitrospira sp.]